MPRMPQTAVCLVLTVGTVPEDTADIQYQHAYKDTYTHNIRIICTVFLTQFLICWIAVEILTVVSPVLL